MVGAVIIAHSSIGKELIATAEYLVGKLEGITAVSIDFEENVFEARKAISQAIKQVDQGGRHTLIDGFFWRFSVKYRIFFLEQGNNRSRYGRESPHDFNFLEQTARQRLARFG